MNDLKSILDIIAASGTPFIAAVSWFVWRIYSNHLPHIEEKIDKLAEHASEDRHEFNRRISFLEGQEIKDRRRRNER